MKQFFKRLRLILNHVRKPYSFMTAEDLNLQTDSSTYMEKRILFIGYCWGSAGSTWLSYLLNSHESILCLHAPAFPRFDRHNYEDVVTMVQAIYSMPALGGKYPFVGFTHGVRLGWHTKLSKIYQDQLRGFILTRHPIKRIQSSAALNERAMGHRTSNKSLRRAFNDIYKDLTRQSNKQFPNDFASLGFYWSCNEVNRILPEYQQNLPIYRLEDLVSQEKVVEELLTYISDGACKLDYSFIQKMQGIVVGKHAERNLSAENTYTSWSEIYKEAYHFLIKREALEIYKQLGYDFPHPI